MAAHEEWPTTFANSLLVSFTFLYLLAEVSNIPCAEPAFWWMFVFVRFRDFTSPHVVAIMIRVHFSLRDAVILTRSEYCVCLHVFPLFALRIPAGPRWPGPSLRLRRVPPGMYHDPASSGAALYSFRVAMGSSLFRTIRRVLLFRYRFSR